MAVNYEQAFAALDSGVVTSYPPELTAPRAAARRVAAMRAALKPPALLAANQLDAFAGRIVLDDTADPGELVAQLNAHRHAEADYASTQQLLALADQIARERLAIAVHEFAAVAIREYLAPAHDEVIAQIRAARKAYAPHSTQRELMTAPKPCRDAWLEVDTLVVKHTTLRTTRYALLRTIRRDNPPRDTMDLFGEISNTEIVWPNIIGRASNNFGTPPWNTDGDARDRLLSLLDLGGEPWCPDPAQQDARWAEVFAEKIEQHGRNINQLQAYRAIGR